MYELWELKVANGPLDRLDLKMMNRRGVTSILTAKRLRFVLGSRTSICHELKYLSSLRTFNHLLTDLSMCPGGTRL
jgi:hypothetical protein